MPTMLKRRYHSSSSSDSSPCWAYRPVKPIPGRYGRQARKVQRIASTHSTIPIPPTLQNHRSKETVFSSTDTELSSSDTELGTALSDVESAINHPESSPDIRISSPERESDEIDDSLGDARMSYSPSPPPAGWAWKDGKMVYDIPVQISWSEKGRAVDGNDRKRRRLEVDIQQEEEDEADDEMEAENMLSTPKQKVKRRVKMWGVSEKSIRAVAPTPSILGITERFNGLTPYCMEMQLSPDQPAFTLDTKITTASALTKDAIYGNDDEDDELVSNALIPSPSPPPKQKSRSKTKASRYIACESSSSISEAKKRMRHRLSASEKRQKERLEPYAKDFLPHLEALKNFTHFDLTNSWDSPEPPSSSGWSYGPLSSPIRLGADSPRKPIKCRILLDTLPGQRTRPNRNLQRRSPTSLIPSRHHSRHPPRPPRTRHSLAIFGPTTFVGQQVITYIHQAKAAREKRRNAVSRQNAQVDYAALAKLRSNCLEGLGKVEAWKNLLWEIQKGCWWWQTSVPLPVAAVQAMRAQQVVSAEEVAVESIIDVVDVPAQIERDVATVDALVNASLPAQQQAAPVIASPSTQRRAVSSAPRHTSVSAARHTRILGTRRAPYADPERAIRAEAVQRRIANVSNNAQPISVSGASEISQVDRDGFESEAAAHRARMASRAAARREQEAEWNTSTDRTAEQRRSLGRQVTEVNIARETIRHVSSLHPTYLSAGPSNLEPAPALEVELEDTDTESDSESESTVSDPPAYDSSSYPRHIPCPSYVHPRRPPTPIQVRLPSYGPNRYSRRSPSPPPPYNAETDRQTLVVPIFIGDDDDDVEEDNQVAQRVVRAIAEPRVVGAFPSGNNRWAEVQDRFDAAPEMEEADLDADEIDELTGGYEGGGQGQGLDRQEGSTLGAIGGFLGRFFGRR